MKREKHSTLATKKRLLVRLIDLLGSVLIHSPGAAISQTRCFTPKKILIVENWGIGDMVLATVPIRALKKEFPEAEISVLGKPHGKVVLENCPHIREYLTFTVPWARLHGKYDFANWPWAGIREMLAELRTRRFDLVVSSRKDVRENLILYLTGGTRRLSFDCNGGGFFLTDVPLGWETGAMHRVDDWHSILDHLGVNHTGTMPKLWLSSEEILWAKNRISALKIDTGKPLIGVHVGASNLYKRWPLKRFERLVEIITGRTQSRVLIFSEPDGYGADFNVKNADVIKNISLRQLMALISECDVFVSNDGGPMHIAAALRIPTVAVFGPTNPEWFGPWGDGHQVVFKTNCRFFPCSEYCRFDSPQCIESIDVEDVYLGVRTQLDRLFK